MRNSISLLVLAACAGSPPPRAEAPGSRGMRASEHLEAARQHDEADQARATWPDSQVAVPGRPDQLVVGSPWRWSWDSNIDHERAASVHRGAAAAQQAEYEEACGTRPASEVSVSPLQRYGIGGTATADGVALYLSPDAGPPERLLADIRCHRAWMMLAPADMEVCPLDLDGLRVNATGDTNGITVTLSVRNRSLIPELQRRAAHELEMTKAQHKVTSATP